MRVTKIVFSPAVYNNKPYNFNQQNKKKEKDNSKFKQILNTKKDELNNKENEIKRSK